MAVRAARALFSAQFQSSWNRLRHKSPMGMVATVPAMLVLVLPILLPGAGMVAVGRHFGEGFLLRAPSALEDWCSFQAVFTLVFALLGSFGFKPALSLEQFGRLPLSRMDLVLAELPAAIFGLFPFLGLGFILMSNLGFASKMPAQAPWVALLAGTEVVWMLALMIAAACLRLILMQVRGAWLLFLLALSPLLFALNRKGPLETLGWMTPGIGWVASHLPGATGYGALAAFLNGEIGPGFAGMAQALAGTAAMVVCATYLHHLALGRGAWRGRKRGGEPAPTRYRGPSRELAGFFFRQMRGNYPLWIQALALPLMFPGLLALLPWECRNMLDRGEIVPPNLVALQQALGEVPLLALGLYLLIAFLSPVWMNQFGWDRTTVRAQMLLPIEVRQILLGRFLGLLQFALLAAGIICACLLTFYRPSLREILAGIPTAGIAFVASWAIGLLISLYAPRAHPPGGLAFPPHYLAWIPAVLMIGLGVALSKVWGLGGQDWPYLAPGLLWLMLAGSLGVAYAVLPDLEKWFLANRKKLLSM